MAAVAAPSRQSPDEGSRRDTWRRLQAGGGRVSMGKALAAVAHRERARLGLTLIADRRVPERARNARRSAGAFTSIISDLASAPINLRPSEIDVPADRPPSKPATKRRLNRCRPGDCRVVHGVRQVRPDGPLPGPPADSVMPDGIAIITDRLRSLTRWELCCENATLASIVSEAGEGSLTTPRYR